MLFLFQMGKETHKKDANSKKHKSSSKTSKDKRKPSKKSAAPSTPALNAPAPSTSAPSTSKEVKRTHVDEDDWIAILQMIRDHYKLLFGKITCNDDFPAREAKWNEILGYSHGLGYKSLTTDKLKSKFNREKRSVNQQARNSKQTGAGGDKALSKMKKSDRLIYDMIKENVEHYKKLKSKIRDGGAWTSDSDNNDDDLSDNQSPNRSPRSGRSRKSSSKGSGVASLNTKLNIISGGGKRVARNLGNSDQESLSGGDVPSINGSKSRSSGGSAHSSESEGEGSVTRARERSPTPDPPGTYDVELPPLLRRSPSPLELHDDNQAVDVPDHGTPADNDPLANVQPLEQPPQPSIEDQIKQQKLEYWQLKVEAKRTKILERKERIKDSKLKRRALRQRFFPMEPDTDDDQFA